MRSDLPTGTVTFLFTDIEGSTRLLQELGDDYASVLAEHHRALRGVWAANGGVEVDTAGDAFFVAFTRATDALAAAGAAQDALRSGPVRVRVGVHTGEPLLTETGYVGYDVHRAARIAAAAHGGQVVVSTATRDLASVDLLDLGEHRLKDLARPERLFQLGSDEFPPLRSLNRTNLPVQPAPLVGREGELAAIGKLLDGTRLLTLTGPGGSGKTRLALHAAAERIDAFPDGTWFVPLAQISDAALVESSIAQVLQARGSVVEHLRDKRALLLLDNFEQLIEAAVVVSQILAGAPQTSILVTSRERLGLASEQEYAVPMLAPDEAVALFADRARRLTPAFEPDSSVAEIAERLDWLPLAIELAAARVKILPPRAMVARLENALDLLTSGARDAPERQRTLRATIDWSYALLEEEEQSALSRLGVFGGSFDLAAAEQVAGVSLDTLGALVDKSLVRVTEAGRFFLLETIREFATETLAADPTIDVARLRAEHCDHYLRVLREGLVTGGGRNGAVVTEEAANIRVALDWAVGTRDRGRAIALALVLWDAWVTQNRLREARHWLERITALAREKPEATNEYVSCLAVLSDVIRLQGDLDAAITLKLEAIELGRAIGADVTVAALLGDLAAAHSAAGRHDEAIAYVEDSLALRLQLGTARGIAHARAYRAEVLLRADRPEEALADAEFQRDVMRTEGRRDYEAASLVAIGEICRRLGQTERAREALREALQIAHEDSARAQILNALGAVALLQVDGGDTARALRLAAPAIVVADAEGKQIEAWAQEAVEAARSALGDDFDAAWAAASAVELDAAVAEALAALS